MGDWEPTRVLVQSGATFQVVWIVGDPKEHMRSLRLSSDGSALLGDVATVCGLAGPFAARDEPRPSSEEILERLRTGQPCTRCKQALLGEPEDADG